MARANLRPIDPEAEADGSIDPATKPVEETYEAELLPVHRPGGELSVRPTRILAELPPPVIAVGGVVAGAAIVSGARILNDARKQRALRRRRAQHGPLVAIMSERIQIDLRSRRR